jgi:hypothetical protein
MQVAGMQGADMELLAGMFLRHQKWKRNIKQKSSRAIDLRRSPEKIAFA